MILFLTLNGDFHDMPFIESVNVNDQKVQTGCNGFTSHYRSKDQL